MLLPFYFCSRGERQKRDERERKREIEEMGERGGEKEHVTELKHLAHGVGVSWPRGDY